MHLEAGTWVIEYGRGISLLTLMIRVADTLTGCTDVYHVFKIFMIWGRAILQELMQLKL